MCFEFLSGWMPSSHLLRWTVSFLFPKNLALIVESSQMCVSQRCLILCNPVGLLLKPAQDPRGMLRVSQIVFCKGNAVSSSITTVGFIRKLPTPSFSIPQVPFFFLRISCPCLKSNSRKALLTPQAPALRLWCQPMPTTC